MSTGCVASPVPPDAGDVKVALAVTAGDLITDDVVLVILVDGSDVIPMTVIVVGLPAVR